VFRSFIYLDEDKLYSYKRQIDGTNKAQPRNMSQRKSKGFSAEWNGIGVNGGTETSIDSEFEKDVSFDYDRFECDLSKLEGEDYFDFVLNGEDYDITSIPAMKLIRICNGFEIPEQFDLVNLIDQFKPMLMGQIETKTVSEQEALEVFLGKASADIPIIVECDGVTISGKLCTQNLHEEYSNLEDYADQDVYMLCKVVGIVKKSSVEVFDPLKDFIKLPRTMRRQMAQSGNSVGIDKITIEGPVLKVEVIAIYK
jgi:hypothetical protein